MAVASLVLGIISIAFFFIFPWLGVILGIIGIVLGVLNSNPEKKGMATAGKVCSIIGLVLCLISAIACTACVSGCGACSNAMLNGALNGLY